MSIAGKIGTLNRLKFVCTRGGVCEKCGNNNAAILQIDHIVPMSEGGSNEADNWQVLCPNCHTEKHYGKMTLSEYKQKLSDGRRLREHNRFPKRKEYMKAYGSTYYLKNRDSIRLKQREAYQRRKVDKNV